MTQRLRTLAALPEDPGSNSSAPQSGSQLLVTPDPGSNALFWPLLALHACSAQAYIQAKHPPNKNIKLNNI